MLSGNNELPQQVIDEIHALAQQLQPRVMVNHSSTAVTAKNRLALQILKQLELLTEKLFVAKGGNAAQIMELLQELKDDAQVLLVSAPKVISSSSLNVNPMGDERLRSVIADIKGIEKTWKFQSQLWNEKFEIAKSLGCNKDQLTYGTSSSELWQAVMRQSIVRQALANNNSSTAGPKIVVFGSSSGLLTFYSSWLVPEAEIIGFEVIPLLHEVASEIKDKYCYSNISLHLADMMTADVSQANVVVLTSLCWDANTRIAVARKLQTEMPGFGVIIDYREDTFSVLPGVDFDASYYSRYASRFDKSVPGSKIRRDRACSEDVVSSLLIYRLHAIVQGCVSWHEHQKLYVYRSV